MRWKGPYEGIIVTRSWSRCVKPALLPVANKRLKKELQPDEGRKSHNPSGILPFLEQARRLSTRQFSKSGKSRRYSKYAWKHILCDCYCDVWYHCYLRNICSGPLEGARDSTLLMGWYHKFLINIPHKLIYMSFVMWLHGCAFRSISELSNLTLAERQVWEGCWVEYAPLFRVDHWATRSIIGAMRISPG